VLLPPGNGRVPSLRYLLFYLLDDVYLIRPNCRHTGAAHFCRIALLAATIPVGGDRLTGRGLWIAGYGRRLVLCIWMLVTTATITTESTTRSRLLLTFYLSLFGLMLLPGLPRPSVAVTSEFFC